MNNTITPEVIASLKAGNHAAFETVFIAYFSNVKAFIDSLIHSGAHAEELTQDVFVRLWMNRAQIDTGQSFGNYLFSMAKNAAFNHLKHKWVEDAYTASYLPPDEECFPEQQLYAKETGVYIDMLVSKMPEQRKRIFEMSRYQGLDNDEIAGRLGVSKKTVENQLSLVLREIRRQL